MREERPLLISVIVPVYNVEKYLDRCIKSIVSQSYKNLEIVLIDDGSTDNSPKICDSWVSKDSRIRVIHKKNEGLGMARNTGLENANGDYICFFDSDDYISLDAIEKCCVVINKFHVDIACFGFYLEDQNGNLIQTVKSDNKYYFSIENQIRDEFIPGMIGFNPITGKSIGLWMSMCGALFSLKLLKTSGWKCESERKIISEDVYSLLLLYSYVSSVYVMDEAFYHYCKNEASLTHIYREDRFEKIKNFYFECIKLCDQIGYSKVIKHEISYPFLNYTIAALKQIVISDCPKKYVKISNIIHDDTLQTILKNTRKDKFSYSQKALFFSMRIKCIIMCYLMLWAKGKMEK